tara:strand:+ start:3393 stop:3626 length:234 start_codon:yes stop_codon:yes gene_type:complete
MAKVTKSVGIELRYRYSIDVEVEVFDDGEVIDDGYEDAKEKAFELACVEHEEATKNETADRNLSDTWQAYDEDGELI